MSRPRRLGLVLAIASGGIVLLAVMGQRLSVSYRTPLTACIDDKGTGGGLGLALWARRIGFTVRALNCPVWEAPGDLERSTGNCLFTAGNGPWSPSRQDVEEADWLKLRNWLAQGNALIVVTTAPGTIPDPCRRDLALPNLENVAKPGGGVPFFQAAVDPQAQTVEVPVADDGKLTVAAGGPRWNAPAARQEGVAGETVSAPRQLAGDNRGGILFRTPVGDGAIYLLLDDFAWTNAGLDHGENARVLATILEREVGGGVLSVDEYRHGHGRAESFLTYISRLPGAAVALGIVGVWGAFYLYGRNVRFRPLEEYRPVERRTAREYIDAVAQLHERARAAPLAVEAVARRLRYLSRGPSELPSATEALLHRAELYAGHGLRPGEPVKAKDLVVQMIRTRKELYGSRTVS